MTTQQWEFCELGLVRWHKHEKSKGFLKGAEEVWSYDCYIRYFGPSGDIFRQLASPGIENALPYNPFFKAMALLGAAGWELVGVQHGTIFVTSPCAGGF